MTGARGDWAVQGWSCRMNTVLKLVATRERKKYKVVPFILFAIQNAVNASDDHHP